MATTLTRFAALLALMTMAVLSPRADAFSVSPSLSSSSFAQGMDGATHKANSRVQRQKFPSCSSSSFSSSSTLFLWNNDDDGDDKPSNKRNNNNNNDIDNWDHRIKCCFPYLLPVIDGDGLFGQYIYERIPPLGLLDDILMQPLVQLFQNVPFLSIAFFLALTLGTRFNLDTMDRDLRFNAQQAALIDVCLILPELVASGFEPGDVPRALAEPCTNFVYYAYMTAVWYSLYTNLVRGQKPNAIPYVSNYAEIMVGPL